MARPMVGTRITRSRWEEVERDAVTFEAFVSSAVNHVDDFRSNYDAVTLNDDDHRLLGDLPAGLRVAAIVEDWCPDVVANLPIVARVADAGYLQLDVVVRGPDTRDVADAFPLEGRSHIPTYVFLDSERTELGVLYERPHAVQAHVDQLLRSFTNEHPELDRGDLARTLSPELRAELSTRSVELRRALRELERRSLVGEIHAVIEDRRPSALVAES